MSEVTSSTRSASRLQPLIGAMERPLLVLAIVAMVLDLVDRIGTTDVWVSRTITFFTAVIDFLFLFDLLITLYVYRRSYTESPWFLIDLLSSLPILDTLANRVSPLRAFRFFRGFRILRIFRGLRVLRMLRTIPAFEQFSREFHSDENSRKTQRIMNLGLLALCGLMLLTIVGVRRSLEREYIRRVDESLTTEVSPVRVKELGGSLVKPESPFVLLRKANVDQKEHDVYFDLRPIDRKIQEFEFFLSLGMLFSMIIFIYLMSYQQLDATRSQLRGLLNLALPRQLAEQILFDPKVYARKSRTQATILFMDFVGFTRVCESLAHDPDQLAAQLETAMDRLVRELEKNDMIIDKFIGDAVMSFRGGPLVNGSAAEHARRGVRATVDSIASLAELGGKHFHRVKIGGASAGDCLIGAFGTRARLSYTILGDGVNLAARLEPACAQCGTQNLFDEATFHLCAGHSEFTWRRWGAIRVMGKTDPVQVYEAFDALRLGDSAFIASFHLALDAFERQNFPEARTFFLLADTQRPGGDLPSQGYAARCETLLRNGRPEGWEPVLETHK
ncbi:MAG: hypothetical protein NVSMB9_06840 [Isosphaeraceae bacterium]